MTHKRHKPNWFRPRFSDRGLLIVLTLLCAYLACWKATKQRGVRDVAEHMVQVEHPFPGEVTEILIRVTVLSGNPTTVVPFVVGMDEYDLRRHRRYYFWFFGYVARLPYQREVRDEVDT